MGACCRMGVPARKEAPPRIRQPAPIPIASPPPNIPPMGMGVCCSFVILKAILGRRRRVSAWAGAASDHHRRPVQTPARCATRARCAARSSPVESQCKVIAGRPRAVQDCTAACTSHWFC
eukprot:1776351-Pyramimonas_sp.AAC.1